MRRTIGKIPYPLNSSRATTPASISAALSTSSGGGRGRGRGGATPFQFIVDSTSQTKPDHSKDQSPSPSPLGHGRGRGKPLPSSPILPSLSSFVNDDNNSPSIGRGRGFIPTSPPPQESQPSQQPPPPPKSNVKMPFLFVEDEVQDNKADSETPLRQEKILPTDIINVLNGAGRGKPIKPDSGRAEKPKVENRHVRSRQPTKPSVAAAGDGGVEIDKKSSPREQLSQEEKVKKAVGILSKGDAESGRGSGAVRGGRGGVRGARGGRGRGRFGGRGRGRGREEERYEESDDDDESGGLYLGDPADGEKLAEKLGPVVMNELEEGFEEMSSRVLPSPVDDAYLDALHTNLLIECEPEYLMEEFGMNPDIDEKPPIPLRDALEKMKPFLMAYEGIQSQEEWEVGKKSMLLSFLFSCS